MGCIPVCGIRFSGYPGERRRRAGYDKWATGNAYLGGRGRDGVEVAETMA